MYKCLLVVLALMTISCSQAKPVNPVKCWERVHISPADLQFVVARLNECTGEVRTTVIKPLKKYLDRMERKVDKFRADEERKQSAAKLF